MAGPSNADLTRRVLAALGRGDVGAFAAIVHPEIEIHTARGVYRGPDEATEWAQKRYEHLERRYAVDGLEERGNEVIARVTMQYVWRESGLVGNEEPAVIHLEFRDGRLVRWEFHEA